MMISKVLFILNFITVFNIPITFNHIYNVNGGSERYSFCFVFANELKD